MWAWPGSRDDDNSTVQTAAMGQIPRSTERILVVTTSYQLTPMFVSVNNKLKCGKSPTVGMEDAVKRTNGIRVF